MRSDSREWSPVGFDTDPTPGTVEAVDALASGLDVEAEWLAHQAQVMSQVKETVAAPAWTGLAAEVFSDRLEATIAAARLAAERHNEGAQLTRSWSMTLSSTQQVADAALTAAEEAIQDLAMAETTVVGLMAQQAGLLATLASTEQAYSRYANDPPPPGTRAPSASDLTAARRRADEVAAELAGARYRLEDAQHRLDAARARAREARDEYELAEDTVIRRLEALLDGAVPPSTRPALVSYVSTAGALTRVDQGGTIDLISMHDTMKPADLESLLSSNPWVLERFLKTPPSPDKVAAWWAKIQGTPKAALLVKIFPMILGNLDGIPFTVRDRCNRDMLAQALKDPRKAYASLPPDSRPDNLDEFMKQVKALRDALKDADDRAVSLPGGTGNKVAQLVVFGVMDGAVTAAVSMGNLDIASNVTVNVPGASSDIAGGLRNQLRAADVLLRAAAKDSADTYAVVSWFGYRSPVGAIEVGGMARAKAGATQLASFLDGVHASRGTAPEQVTVVGHSYGSTTASEALSKVKYPIDDFISFGSVGFRTRVSDLNVGQVYATEAKADGIAIWGRNASNYGRTDPLDIPGVIPFSSEQTSQSKGVTGHDLYPESEDKNGKTSASRTDVGYLTPGSSSQKAVVRIMHGMKPR